MPAVLPSQNPDESDFPVASALPVAPVGASFDSHSETNYVDSGTKEVSTKAVTLSPTETAPNHEKNNARFSLRDLVPMVPSS